MSKAILHVDLHPIARQGRAVDTILATSLATAERKRLRAIEIIPGKGSGQLMQRVKRWLRQPAVKQRYKRCHVDAMNHGRIFVYLR